MRFEGFRQNALVSSLGWPDDVVEQFLYDHADKHRVLARCGRLDSSEIEWDVEVTRSKELIEMPTSASDGDCIEDFAANPDHWVRVRNTRNSHWCRSMLGNAWNMEALAYFDRSKAARSARKWPPDRGGQDTCRCTEGSSPPRNPGGRAASSLGRDTSQTSVLPVGSPEG